MRRIGERQRWVWLAAGLSAVASVELCGIGWLWVLLGGLAVCGYYLYIEKNLLEGGLAEKLTSGFGFAGKVLAALTVFWIILVMGRCACLVDTAFPMVDGFPTLGWVLLALAAWGSRKGAKACAGCSGILSLFLIALYGVVTVFSVPDVQLPYLVPQSSWEDGVRTVGFFLLPAAVWYVPVTRRKGKKQAMILLVPIAAAALSAVTAGVLSPELARQTEVPVYELSRSVSVLGVVERIEPLLSAAMTMGLFSLLSAMACACQMLADEIVPTPWSGSLCCVAAAGTMYVVKAWPEAFLLMGNGLFFLLLPVVTIVVEKNFKKSKKRC